MHDDSVGGKTHDAALRRIASLEDAVHKAFNQMENITVADTLEIAKDRAHAFIGWAYNNLPGYQADTATEQTR